MTGKQDLGNERHLPFHRRWIPDSIRQHREPHVIDPENVAYKTILEVQHDFDRSYLARSNLLKRQVPRVKCRVLPVGYEPEGQIGVLARGTTGCIP